MQRAERAGTVGSRQQRDPPGHAREPGFGCHPKISRGGVVIADDRIAAAVKDYGRVLCDDAAAVDGGDLPLSGNLLGEFQLMICRIHICRADLSTGPDGDNRHLLADIVLVASMVVAAAQVPPVCTSYLSDLEAVS